MLKVSIHTGALTDVDPANQLAVLDIGYDEKKLLSKYLVAMSLSQSGELTPSAIQNYPRWSASLWDLVARGITAVLYQSDQCPPADKPDRRCAYATKICAVIHRETASDRAALLGSVEISQTGKQRGMYTASFTEDILGPRSAQFEYGCKRLNPADLLLRAICWTYFKTDVLGPWPKLVVPDQLEVDGQKRFHVEGLAEPAKTGFRRFMAQTYPSRAADPMPLTGDYVYFLVKG